MWNLSIDCWYILMNIKWHVNRGSLKYHLKRRTYGYFKMKISLLEIFEDPGLMCWYIFFHLMIIACNSMQFNQEIISEETIWQKHCSELNVSCTTQHYKGFYCHSVTSDEWMHFTRAGIVLGGPYMTLSTGPTFQICLFVLGFCILF